jgi:FlaA1/EpsC-like NDP-sugar epimerase
MKRYFMTIPEAVSLIIQAGAFGHRNVTYILDMGEEVPIVELAKRVIQLHGLRVGTDIEIAFTGIRPGEKLYEELTLDFEAAYETSHPKVRRISGVASRLELTEIPGRLAELVHLANEGDPLLATRVHQLIQDIDGESPALTEQTEDKPFRIVHRGEPNRRPKIATISTMAQERASRQLAGAIRANGGE